MNFKNDKKKGFTLVELLVAMTIFSILIVTIYESLMALLVVNRKVALQREVQAEVSDMVGFIYREIRREGCMIDVPGDNNGNKVSLGCFGGNPSISYDDSNNKLLYSDDGDINNNPINSSKVKIEKVDNDTPVFGPVAGNDMSYVDVNFVVEASLGKNTYRTTVSTTIAPAK